MTELTIPIKKAFNPFVRVRRKTREVKVGAVGVGGSNPLRIQSMTTTPTMDTMGTVEQTARLVEAGCEIVRITAPTIREARNLENIKEALLQRGLTVPLVADIHFRPDAALVAADFVEKVRVNPGNYADGKAFKVREYTEAEYENEISRIEERFTPLVLKLKNLGKSLRIGTNHGSLSDRIMNRFGDTPLGMVESALEFARICRKNNFHDIIFSMKASNPRVMVSAYRLLADRLDAEGWDYPFHLGVTEAGDGEDGRIKSSAGIGSLLEDGIGDTIRVSLTEDPEFEIPVARSLAGYYGNPANLSLTEEEPSASLDEFFDYVDDRYSFSHRHSDRVPTGPFEIGGGEPSRLVSFVNVADWPPEKFISFFEERLKKDQPPEILLSTIEAKKEAVALAGWIESLKRETSRVAFWVSEADGNLIDPPAGIDGLALTFQGRLSDQGVSFAEKIAREKNVPIILRTGSVSGLVSAVKTFSGKNIPVIAGILSDPKDSSVHKPRLLSALLAREGLKAPLIFFAPHGEDKLKTASIQGSLICDGLGDAVQTPEAVPLGESLDFSYNLLQACGTRLTKTEFVSCPSCGRTLFDLQSTTERIKKKTGHLKGVKIAIMGCIVNGPGEMADADFGYVGGGPGKINLYVGKDCVEKSIASDVADERLIELIKEHGKWVEKTG